MVIIQIQRVIHCHSLARSRRLYSQGHQSYPKPLQIFAHYCQRQSPAVKRRSQHSACQLHLLSGASWAFSPRGLPKTGSFKPGVLTGAEAGHKNPAFSWTNCVSHFPLTASLLLCLLIWIFKGDGTDEDSFIHYPSSFPLEEKLFAQKEWQIKAQNLPSFFFIKSLSL